MSDDLDIRSGGAVAVDTATLRAAASGFRALAEELDEIARLITAAAHRLAEVSESAFGAASAIEAARRRVGAARDAALDIDGSLRDAAAVYEIVELRAERAAAEAAGDAAAVARIDARRAVLAQSHPDAEERADLGMLGRWLGWPGELARQAPGALWWLAPGFHAVAIPVTWSLQRAIGAIGAGTVPAGSALRGPASAVAVTPVAPRGPLTAPASLTDAAARIPGGGETRVRVERYTMGDGSRQFAVYVTGTQTASPHTREPFDMASNVQLYTGERSASYDATLAALQSAGARPGDVLHAFGHSQGAMVVTHVAMEAGYDTRTVVTFGSPIDGELGADTLSVTLRHTDDPVVSLAAGGHTGSVGAAGSLIAERAADPLPGVHDMSMPAHGIDAYTHTARLLDASDDTRLAAVRQVFDGLGAAASVEVMEYSAVRTHTGPEPQPRPAPAPLSPSSSGAG